MTGLLRARTGHEAKVGAVELFFDLVFVFAITQLSHALLAHLTPLGALQSVTLFMAVWWVWMYTCWFTNWLDPERTPVRLLLFTLMAAGLVLSMSIPEAWAERGLSFALAYVGMQLGRSLFTVWALRGGHSPANFRNFIRISVWFAGSGIAWIAGGLSDAETRLALWLLALGIEYSAPALYYRVPGLGRATTAEWDIDGRHFAERCGLFIIIALGESILVTGATAAELAWTGTVVAGFATALVGSIAMWWIYFNIGAERAARQIAASADPGRVARLVYTYIHLPIVAGIVVSAAADELVLAHPEGHLDAASATMILGGPALFLVGNLLFKKCTAGWWPLSHLAGLGALAVLVAAVPLLSPLALGAGTSLVLLVVAVWETLSLRPRARAALSRRPS